MLEKLKPCPVCGHAPEHPRDFFDCDGENVFYVGCDNKDCPADIGIIHEDVEEAAHIWNAIPRPLRWTKEPPTDPGWYFCQRICPGEPKHYPLRVVHIHYDVVMGKRVLCYGGCAFYGVEDDRQESSPLCDISKSALEEMCWAGPILEPVK